MPEFRHLRVGSVLSENSDDSVTIMARIRLARIAFTNLNLQKAAAIFKFGTTGRRVALESKKTTYDTRSVASESFVVWIGMLGCNC